MASTSKPKRTLLTLMRMGSESTVTGPEGVILRIIGKATEDYYHPKSELWRLDAIEFFQGELYQHYLGLLDLPVDLLPDGIERADLERQRPRIRKGC